MRIPTIAAIDGPALGGGLEMTLCCDFRLAGPNAIMGLPETSLGIIPGAGGTQRLARLIGLSRAKQLIFTSHRFDSKQGRSLGIINTLFNNDGQEPLDITSSGLEQAIELAQRILPQAPLAIQMAKKAIDEGSSLDLGTGLEIEQLCYAPLFKTEDRLEGLRAFKEKRKPHL